MQLLLMLLIPQFLFLIKDIHLIGLKKYIFLVHQIRPTDPITCKMKDLNGEEIEGTFYREELQKTDQTIFIIEKVIRKTKDKAFVKWKGYPDQFNSWVSLKDLKNL